MSPVTLFKNALSSAKVGHQSVHFFQPCIHENTYWSTLARTEEAYAASPMTTILITLPYNTHFGVINTEYQIK